jgi:hypothetical protein
MHGLSSVPQHTSMLKTAQHVGRPRMLMSSGVSCHTRVTHLHTWLHPQIVVTRQLNDELFTLCCV